MEFWQLLRCLLLDTLRIGSVRTTYCTYIPILQLYAQAVKGFLSKSMTVSETAFSLSFDTSRAFKRNKMQLLFRQNMHL